MYEAFRWLIAVELLGIIAFPVVFLIFRRLPDRGYTLSKVFAFLVVFYVWWVLGLTNSIPASRSTLLVIVVVFAVFSIVITLRHRWSLKSFVRSEGVLLVASELLFVVFYLGWLAFVSHTPQINHTEKPMDFGFLNAVLQSSSFPAEDPWLSGHSISYYYFGHLVLAGLTKLTAITSNISYNLSIALIASLVTMMAYGLMYNLIRISGGSARTALIYALSAPLFLGMISNLEGVFEFIKAQGWGSNVFWNWVNIKGLDGPAEFASVYPKESWWNWGWRSTRVIDTVIEGKSLDYTITEYPFFSYILGDLHAHVISLPFLILNISLGINLLLSPTRIGFCWLKKHFWETFFIALSLGALGFINLIDLPVFSILFVTLVLLKRLSQEPELTSPTATILVAVVGGSGVLLLGFLSYMSYMFSRGIGPVVISVFWPVLLGLVVTTLIITKKTYRSSHILVDTLILVVPVLVGSFILFLPFYIDFNTQVSGVLPVREVSTRPLHFLIIWGLFLVLGISFVFKQLPTLSWNKDKGLIGLIFTIILIPVFLWSAVEMFLSSFENAQTALTGFPTVTGLKSGFLSVISKFAKIGPGLVVVGLALYSAVKWSQRSGFIHLTVPLLLLAVGLYLIVGAELFRLADVFNNRMNTVFKLYYQAWIFLAIACSYGLYYLLSRWDAAKLFTKVSSYIWLTCVVMLIMGSVYYVPGAALSKLNLNTTPTLDGLAFIKDSSPGEYEAIEWLRDKAPKGRLVEAAEKPEHFGASTTDYSDYGRVSASTGLPTIINWEGHQLQWRGSTDLLLDRVGHVREIYLSRDVQRVQDVLDKYEVRYVYVGRRERESYGQDIAGKFERFLRPVFSTEDVFIYENVRK